MDLENIYEDMQGMMQPFPYRIRTSVGTEGTAIDIVDGGIMAVGNIPEATPGECKAFMTGFQHYSYQEVEAGGYSIAWWIFKMPAPLGFAEATFHASLSKPDDLKLFLDRGDNVLSMYMIDHQIQRLPRMRYELDPRCTDMFRATIERQLANPIRDERHYYKTVKGVMSDNKLKEMFERGTRFRHYDKRTGTITLNAGGDFVIFSGP